MKVDSNNRVLYMFTEEFPFSTGETFIENEIEYLAKAFHKINIVAKNTTSNKKREIPKNVTVIRNSFCLNFTEKLLSLFAIFSPIFRKEIQFIISNKVPLSLTNVSYMLHSLARARKVKDFLERQVSVDDKTDEIYLYSYWWLDESIGIAYFKNAYPNVIAISRCHGYDVYSERAFGNYLPLKGFTIGSLDKVFTISNHARNYVCEKYKNVNDEKISINRLGLKGGKLQLLHAHNIDEFTVVSCSQIYPNKRIHLLLDAILRLEIKVRWIHFGGQMKGFSEEYYQSIMNKIKLNDSKLVNIEFKGNRENEEILKFYEFNHVDLFVNVSESEGIPVSIMEAMSFSIPVMATDVGGTSEIVNSENGKLISADIDSLNLKLEIEKFHNYNVEQVNKKRNSAYQSFVKNYSASKNYNDFVDQIEEIKNKRNE